MAKTDTTKVQEFDDILEAVGSFGRYQKLRLAFFYVPLAFIIGSSSTSPVFEMVVPAHWCHVPGRENTSLTPQEWKTLTVPPDGSSGKLSSCLMYDGFWEMQNGSLTYAVTNDTKECSHGWEFDRTYLKETVPSAYGWVCSKEHYAYRSLSLNLAGRAVGTFLLPMIADNYVGRRRMFFLAVGIQVVFTLPLLWVSNAPIRFLFRFLQGFGIQTNYLMPNIIIMEIIHPTRRDFVMMLSFVSWSTGVCVMALVAWLAARWDVLAIVTMVPLIASFMYWRVLPESPRWLLSKGRLRECADILIKIGATNGAAAVSRDDVEEDLRALSLHMPPNEPLTKAFVHPKLRLRIIILCLISFLQFIIYGILLLSMSVMPGNYFVNHAVLTIPDIFSTCLVGLPITHYFGRRFLGYSFLLVSAVFFIAAPLCVNNTWTLLGLLAVAKVSIICLLYLIFLLPTEILPTPVRTSGAGMTVVSGMVGMTLAPQLINSGMGDTFHYWVMVGITLITGIILWPLPETLGLAMPQTFRDGEELGRGRPSTVWIHHWNVHKYSTPTPHDEMEELKDMVDEKEC